MKIYESDETLFTPVIIELETRSEAEQMRALMKSGLLGSGEMSRGILGYLNDVLGVNE